MLFSGNQLWHSLLIYWLKMYTYCFLYGYLFDCIFPLTIMLTWCMSDMSYSLFHFGISEKHRRNIQRSSSGFLPEAEIETNYPRVSNNNSCPNSSLKWAGWHTYSFNWAQILIPTAQEKTVHMDVIRWPTPKSDWSCSLQPKMEKLYTVSKNKTGSWLWLRPWTPSCKIQT